MRNANKFKWNIAHPTAKCETIVNNIMYLGVVEQLPGKIFSTILMTKFLISYDCRIVYFNTTFSNFASAKKQLREEIRTRIMAQLFPANINPVVINTTRGSITVGISDTGFSINTGRTIFAQQCVDHHSAVSKCRDFIWANYKLI